jgi:hypothetical protein
MIGFVEKVAPLCVIHEIPGITKCFLNEDEDTGKVCAYLLLHLLSSLSNSLLVHDHYGWCQYSRLVQL